MTVIWRLAAYAGISYLLWSITLYLAWQMEMSTRFLHTTQWFWIISTTIILEANHQVAVSKEAKREEEARLTRIAKRFYEEHGFYGPLTSDAETQQESRS